MRRSWLASAVVVIAVLVAYAVSTAPARAQGDAVPFQVGDVVVFAFQGGGSRQCRIEEMRGLFARCGSAADREGASILRREPPNEWVNVATVEWVTVPRERR